MRPDKSYLRIGPIERKTTITTTATLADVRPMKSLVRTGRDLALLVCRIGLGVLMIAHAKLEFDFGGGSLSGVGALFAQSGVPLPAITGPANVPWRPSAAWRSSWASPCRSSEF
jgi:hypothetical protein